MKHHKMIILIAVVVFISCGSYIMAQSDNSDKIVRKVCIFTFPDISVASQKSKDAEIFQTAIKENLVFELKTAGFQIVDDKKVQEILNKQNIKSTDLMDGSKAMELASQAAGDVVITGFFRLDESRIIFGIKCYDILGNRLAVSVLKDGRAGVSLSSSINNAIKEIIPLIKEQIPPISSLANVIEKEVEVVKTVVVTKKESNVKRITLTFKSPDENAQLYFADRLIGEIKDGTLDIKAKANSQLQVEVRKKDCHPATKTYDLPDDDITIELDPLIKVNNFAIEAEYAVFQFFGAGVGFRYYIVPDWVYATISDYFFLQTTFAPSTSPVIHNNFNITIGLYGLFDPDSWFRMSLYMGLGLIITNFTVPDMPWFMDYYWDCLGINFEFNVYGWSFYLKEAGRYFLGIGDNLLGQAWNSPWPVYFSVGVLWKW